MLYNILIGLLAGWIVNKFYRKVDSTLWQNLILGVVGSLLGGFLADLLGFHYGKNLVTNLLVACVGAVLALGIKARFIDKPKSE